MGKNYRHLTHQQRASIRKIAARIYAAADGWNTIPLDIAEARVRRWSIDTCLESFNDSHMDELGFDPDTGEAWES